MFLVIAWKYRRGLEANGGMDMVFLGPYTEAEAQAACANMRRLKIEHKLHPLTTDLPEWMEPR